MKDFCRVKIVVNGDVQGVFFRYSAKRKAEELSITGFVKNLFDGKVEIVAEGDKENLQKLIAWAQVGPPSARVTSCETEWHDATGEFREFFVE